MGVSDELKGYRLFNPKTEKIVVSKDVVFEEEKSWDWDEINKEQVEADLSWGDDDFSEDENEGCDGVDSNNEEGGETGNEARNSQENVNQGRERRAPRWMNDYESGEGLSEKERERGRSRNINIHGARCCG